MLRVFTVSTLNRIFQHLNNNEAKRGDAIQNTTHTHIEIQRRNMQGHTLLPSRFMRSHDHEEEDFKQRRRDFVSLEGKHLYLHEYDHSYRYPEPCRRDKLISFSQPLYSHVSRKGSLDFILNGNERILNGNESEEFEKDINPQREAWVVASFHKPSPKIGYGVGYDERTPHHYKMGGYVPSASIHRHMEVKRLATSESIPRHVDPKVIRAEQERLEILKRKKRLLARICKAEGCDKYVVDHGLCIRHGGGKRCSVERCGCRAQNKGLCWKHGGYTICTVEGCNKRAKSRGICWSHGGGTRCKYEDCSKVAVSHGLCWAHGGGKRCLVHGCKRPGYQRNGNLCSEHVKSIDPQRFIVEV